MYKKTTQRPSLYLSLNNKIYKRMTHSTSASPIHSQLNLITETKILLYEDMNKTGLEELDWPGQLEPFKTP